MTAPTRIKLSEFRERRMDQGAIDIEVDDGTVFRIPPPELWPDEVSAIPRSDVVATARAVLGDQWDGFVAAGGTAGLLNAIFTEVHSGSPGESSGSSSS